MYNQNKAFTQPTPSHSTLGISYIPFYSFIYDVSQLCDNSLKENLEYFQLL